MPEPDVRTAVATWANMAREKTAQLKRLHILELYIRRMAMSITARLATGTILLLALAGCTERPDDGPLLRGFLRRPRRNRRQ